MKRITVLALSLALVASACSDGAEQKGDSALPSSLVEDRAQQYLDEMTPFDTEIDGVIESAREGGAGDRQLELLNEAKRQGEVTFQLARDATESTLECFQQSGLEASYMETTDAGIPYPEYMVKAQGDNQTALRDQCETQHYFWVSMLYQTQTANREQTIAYIERQYDALATCIHDAGHDTDPDATAVELAFYALEVASETEYRVNCLYNIGVSSF